MNIFHLSNDLERIAPLKLQVVLGLGSAAFGASYSATFYFKKYPLIKTGLTLVNAFFLYIAYLFVLKLYTYRVLDIIIFLLAVHGRALKSIIAITDSAKSKEAKKIPAEIKLKKSKIDKTMNFIDVWMHPKKTATCIPYDKVFEELVFRLLVLSNVHILYKLPYSDFQLLITGILFSGLSYGIRYIEHILTKSTAPGLISEDAYEIYMCFLYLVFVTEIYTEF